MISTIYGSTLLILLLSYCGFITISIANNRANEEFIKLTNIRKSKEEISNNIRSLKKEIIARILFTIIATITIPYFAIRMSKLNDNKEFIISPFIVAILILYNLIFIKSTIKKRNRYLSGLLKDLK